MLFSGSCGHTHPHTCVCTCPCAHVQAYTHIYRTLVHCLTILCSKLTSEVTGRRWRGWALLWGVQYLWWNLALHIIFFHYSFLPVRGRPTTSTLDHVQGPPELLGTRDSWAQDQRIGGGPFLLFGGSRGQEGKSKWYSFSLRAPVRSGISSQSSNLLHCPGLHTLKGHPKWVFPLVVSYIISCCVDFYFKVSFWWSEPKTGVILSKGSCPLNSPALSPPPIRRLHCPALVLCGRVLIWSSRGRWNITFTAN